MADIDIDLDKLKNEVEKLNLATNKTMDLSLALQKKVSDLQEDSFLNAQHINAIKSTHQMHIDKTQTILKKHITDTDNFIVELAEEDTKKGVDNYTNFIKGLLTSDFKALQNETLEEVKRQFTKNKGKKPSESKGNKGFSFNIIFNLMSLASFIFLIYLCMKYKLL